MPIPYCGVLRCPLPSESKACCCSVSETLRNSLEVAVCTELFLVILHTSACRWLDLMVSMLKLGVLNSDEAVDPIAPN